jgi:mycothiol synthase
MAIVVQSCQQDHLPSLRALARDPSLAHEFAQLQTDPGFDDMMADPFLPVDLRWIATIDGDPAGFAFSFLAPTHGGSFAMVRMGVVERHRRRGVGSALLAAADAKLTAIRDRDHLNELNLSAWEPNPAAVGFATRHGFRHVRNFWRMERPLGPVKKPQWPAGIVMRTYDGSERALEEFNDAYNRSFAGHYHYVRSSLEDSRVITTQRHFRPDGLALAHRGDACVGFCRNARYGDPGEVALIGTVPEARGIGLGRALLRWGVGWLQDDFAHPVYLMVDGENESALRLYRSEGFQVALTRLHWSRAIGD